MRPSDWWPCHEALWLVLCHEALIGEHVMSSPSPGPGPRVSAAGPWPPRPPRVWRRYHLTRKSGDHPRDLWILTSDWSLTGFSIGRRPSVKFSVNFVTQKTEWGSDLQHYLLRPNRRWWAVGGRWRVVCYTLLICCLCDNSPSHWLRLITWPDLWLADYLVTRGRQLCVSRWWWTCSTSPLEPWCWSCTTRLWSGPSTPTSTTTRMIVNR